MKLNRNQLKYIVVLAMVIDHIAWSFVPMASVLGQVMHFIGRLTGPTMAFFLAEGYLHTRSVKRYALRLGLFALISWVPYSFYEKGYWPSAQFGVIYTLFLGLLAVWVYDKARIPRWAKRGAILALCGLSFFGDWPVFDVIWPVLLFKYRDDPERKWRSFFIIAAASALLSVLEIVVFKGVSQAWTGLFQLGVLAVPPLLRYCYSGEPGSRKPFHKWFFYWFYPAHLLALWLLERTLG